VIHHHTSVVPIKTTRYCGELGVRASSVVAYRAVCSCGWRSSARATVALARLELADHRPVATAGAGEPGGV
jgi:hypothetical protein